MNNSSVTTKKKRFPVTLEQTALKTTARDNPHKPDWFTLAPKKNITAYSVHSEGTAGSRGYALDALRVRMVQRLAALGIRNQLVLDAMAAVPRHIFVDTALANQSYEDTSLPIGLEQTISKPSVVARMLELIMPVSGERLGNVLDIGTGCGYQAAVLSLLASKVCSMERLKGLHERARSNLRPLALKNVHLIYGDGMQGFAASAPYDVIIAAAGGDDIPQAWLEQLSIGGALIAPMTLVKGQQALVKVVREVGGWKKTVLDAVQFVPLKSGIA